MRHRPGEVIRAKSINDVEESTQPKNLQISKGLMNSGAGIVCLGQNDTAGTIEPFDVMQITGQVLSRGYNQRSVVVRLDTPPAGNNSESIAVCLDNIPPGSTGRVVISGVAWALTDGATGTYAQLEDGNTYLSVGTSGPAEVLAMSGNYGLIRFPCGSGGGSIGPVVDHYHDSFLISATE